MRVLTIDEYNLEKDNILQSIMDGAVFIHPTDTIYGMGCNAQISSSVKKVRELKSRIKNPFSVIAPSLDWVRENCIVSSEGEQWLKKLPGPYTLIFKLKNDKCVAKDVNVGFKTIGVRVPKHWITKLVAEAEVPVVTTSVNKSGEEYMTSLDDLDDSLKEGIGFVLYEGEKKGKPSRLVDLTKKAKVIER